MTRDTRWVLLVVAIAILRSVVLAVFTPPYQSSDEPWHLDYARVVSEGHLPVLSRTVMSPAIVEDDRRVTSTRHLTLYGIGTPAFSREAFQPPLSYVAPGVAYRLIRRPSRALAAFRGLDALAGALVAAVAFFLGRRAFPGSAHAGRVAGLTAACLPSVSVATSTADNDALAILLALGALMGMMTVVRAHVSPGRLVGLGVTIGLAALAKTSGLLLLVPAAVAMTLGPRSADRSARRRAWGLAIVAAAALAVDAPWAAWNVAHYREPLGTSAFSPFHPQPGSRIGGWRLLLGARPTLHGAARLWPEVARTSVGVLRWADLYLPAWTYAVAGAAVLLGGLAAARWLGARASGRDTAGDRDRAVVLVVLTTVLAYVAGMVWYAFTVDYQPQGRYLIPALLAGAAVLGAGLERRGLVVAGAVLLTLLCAAIGTTIGTYRIP